MKVTRSGYNKLIRLQTTRGRKAMIYLILFPGCVPKSRNQSRHLFARRNLHQVLIPQFYYRFHIASTEQTNWQLNYFVLIFQDKRRKYKRIRSRAIIQGSDCPWWYWSKSKWHTWRWAPTDLVRPDRRQRQRNYRNTSTNRIANVISSVSYETVKVMTTTNSKCFLPLLLTHFPTFCKGEQDFMSIG